MLVNCVKRDSRAIIPSRAHNSDIGYDLTAIKKYKVLKYGAILYDTGIAASPPPGYYLEIIPRSSLSKTGWMLANSVGIVDPDYTGNLYIALVRVALDAPELTLPFCKCQLVIRKINHATFREVNNLDDTIRGTGGFGSTGVRIN